MMKRCKGKMGIWPFMGQRMSISYLKIHVAFLAGIQPVVGRRWESHSSYFALSSVGGLYQDSETLHRSPNSWSCEWFGIKETPEFPHCKMRKWNTYPSRKFKQEIGEEPLTNETKQNRTEQKQTWGVSTWGRRIHTICYNVKLHTLHFSFTLTVPHSWLQLPLLLVWEDLGQCSPDVGLLYITLLFLLG